MRLNKRIWAMLLCALMIVANLPIQVYATSGDTTTVYTSFTSTEAATGTGTQADPFNYFEDALAALPAEGGIIIIGAGGAYIGTQTGNEMLPFLIDKEVTIKAGEGATFSIRRAGVVLGADVTFEGVSFSFANREKNAIFANGHTLILTNTTQAGGTREVHLFAGGIYDLDTNGSAYDYAAYAGSHGKIVINGPSATFGNIYAGSMNTTSALSATITINGAANMDIGDIYASGAVKGSYNQDDLFSGAEPTAPLASASVYPVSGAVSVVLNKSNVTNIYGTTGGSTNAAVEILTENRYETLSMNGVASLKIAGGVVAPASLNTGVNIEISSGAVLDFNTVMATNNNTFSVNNFTGGGSLRMGQTDTLTINGTVSGSTAFQTTVSMPVDGSTSGIVELEHAYIVAPSGTAANAFTFIPNVMQDYVTLECNNGIFTAKASSHVCEDTLSEFAAPLPLSGSVSAGTYYLFDDVQATGNIAIDGNSSLCLNGYVLDMGDYSLVAGATLNICNCWGMEGFGGIEGDKDVIVVKEGKTFAATDTLIAGVVRNFGTISHTGCEFIGDVWNYETFTGENTQVNLIESVDVTFALTNFAANSPTTVTASIKRDYVCTLSPAENYQLPSTITVKMAGKTVAANDAYTYNSATGQITIKATEITGNITIEAECTQISHTCSGGMATCTALAVCTGCGNTYGSTNPTNHAGGTEVRDAVTPTETQAGYTGDTYCLGCSVKIATGTTIPATGDGNSGGNSGGAGSSNSGETGGSTSGGNGGENNPAGSTGSVNNTPQAPATGTVQDSSSVVQEPVQTKPVYEVYTVRRGDTLWSIARKHNCTIAEILQANRELIKNPNRIVVGWRLQIPQEQPETGNSDAPITGEETEVAYIVHIVKRGDSLWKLSRRYGCTVKEIIAINDRLQDNPNLILPGWEIRIPKE